MSESIDVLLVAACVLLAILIYLALAHARALRTAAVFLLGITACAIPTLIGARLHIALALLGLLATLLLMARFEQWMLRRSVRLDFREREKLNRIGTDLRQRMGYD